MTLSVYYLKIFLSSFFYYFPQWCMLTDGENSVGDDDDRVGRASTYGIRRRERERERRKVIIW